MKYLRVLLPFLFIVSSLEGGLLAQDPPHVEVFGGVSYFRTDVDVPDQDLLGFDASVALNTSRWLGLVADFGWYFNGLSLQVPGISGNFDSDVQTYLFGPRFTARGTRFQPFAHLLFGGARAKVDALGLSVSDSSFAAAFGAGFDYAPGTVGWRIIQADYLVTTFGSDTQNDVRISTGLLLRF